MEPSDQQSPDPAAIGGRLRHAQANNFEGLERSSQLNLERREKQAGSYRGLKGVQTIQCVCGMKSSLLCTLEGVCAEL